MITSTKEQGGRTEDSAGACGRANRNSGDQLTRAATLLLCTIFGALLWMPAVDFLFHVDPSPVPIENRTPASFPVWSRTPDALKKYLAGLESCFNDHFGFRKLFIRAHGYFQHRWFHEGTGDVLIGRDQWLFYVGDRALDDHLGLKALTPQRLREWQQLLEKRQAWLAQRGIKYLCVVPPNKESVYPEYLPEWATKPGAMTDLDQLIAHLRANSTVEILDLRPALIEAKKQARVYLLTDTHWNYLGGFIGYREIITALERQLPGLHPVALEAFEMRRVNQPGGDLAAMLAQEQSMPEPDCVNLVPKPSLPSLKIQQDPGILEKKWLPNQVPLTIENPVQTHKALMFRDSFAAYMVPYLGYNFKRTVLISQRAWDLGVIEREHPDVVIDEMLERYLSSPVPDQ